MGPQRGLWHGFWARVGGVHVPDIWTSFCQLAQFIAGVRVVVVGDARASLDLWEASASIVGYREVRERYYMYVMECGLSS